MSIESVRVWLRRALGDRARPEDLSAMRAALDAMGAAAPLPPDWRVTEAALAGRPAEHHTGPGCAPGRTILYLHGGAFVAGSAKSHRGLAAWIARCADSQSLVLDYRLAPEHPFPAALDDCLAAAQALLTEGQDPRQWALVGDSAGANLALATAFALRDRGLPQPAALALISPWLDLTLQGRSHATRAEAEAILSTKRLRAHALDYAGGVDPADPRVSPLFADFAGLAPMLIHVGADEILLSDAEEAWRRADRAGADPAMETWPNMIHVWHALYPHLEQARDAIEGLGGWIARRLKH